MLDLDILFSILKLKKTLKYLISNNNNNNKKEEKSNFPTAWRALFIFLNFFKIK